MLTDRRVPPRGDRLAQVRRGPRRPRLPREVVLQAEDTERACLQCARALQVGVRRCAVCGGQAWSEPRLGDWFLT